MQNEVKALALEFFEKLNIKIDNLEVRNSEESNIFNLKIETEESGILIGPHGRNLDSIQSILKLMSSRKVGERVKVHIEINDYVKTKDDRLFDFIKSKIQYLEKTGNDIQLPFYSAYERKKIHGFISGMKERGISSKSIGEGKERRIYLCKKAPKLTIDIDGDDI